MPVMSYRNIEKLMAMDQAIQRDKHDLEDTVMAALTHREVALLVSGCVLIDIFFPEYTTYTDDLISKMQTLTKARNFFATRRFEDPGEGEEPLDDIHHPGGDT